MPSYKKSIKRYYKLITFNQIELIIPLAIVFFHLSIAILNIETHQYALALMMLIWGSVLMYAHIIEVFKSRKSELNLIRDIREIRNNFRKLEK